MDLRPGTTLGSYKLEALIGEGGMGRVFQATHVRLGKTVAVKVLHGKHAERPEMVKRFFREAKVISQLDHENIVQVSDFVEEDGLAYCVMEYLEGQSLESLLKKEGSLSLARTAQVMSQVCDAVQAAHDSGVVHRDLKPDNIFLVKKAKDDDATVKVLDFGVAKLLEPQKGTQYTEEGTVLGTPVYMSPEQASGMPVDRRADIYSTGVICYRLLSGKLPFNASNFAELLAKLVHDPPPPLPEKTPKGDSIPPALSQLVMKCLAKKPKGRPAKISELGQAFDKVGSTPSRPAVQRKPKRRPRRPRRIGLLGGAVGLAALGGIAFFALRPKEASRVEHELVNKVESEIPKLPSKPFTPSPEPAKVAIEIASHPEGAVVTRLDTGEVLGKTPLKAQLLQKKNGELALRLNLAGYEPSFQKASVDKDGSLSVALKAIPKKAPPRSTPKKHAKTRRGA